MKAVYWQRGESLDYTNSGATVIEANSIIDLGIRIAVAGTSINPKETGSIHVTGVYRIKKKDSGAINFGAAVYYDATDLTGGITTTATSMTPAGYAAEESAAGADTILVKLLG